jgi:hypothetical protein
VPTAKDVADWMAAKLNSEDVLYQQYIVWEIAQKFGDQFTHINNRGGQSISTVVLREFRKLTEDTAIWDRHEKMWRKRADYDLPGRLQR